MLDRADRLSRYHFQWPVPTTAVVVSVMRWAMLAVILAAAGWLVRRKRQATKGEGLSHVSLNRR
jgi:LPXTG-motif cell wall-anchored protein